MIIKCRKCGGTYDLKSRVAIELYMKGEYAIGCRKCGMAIYNKKESALNGEEEEDGE